MERICQKCGKTYASRQSLWNHKKYCKGGTKQHSFLAGSQNHQPSLAEKKPVNSKISALIDATDDSASADIPTFDGAEFSGEKPLSDETLFKMMEMLKIPHENRAHILKEEFARKNTTL